MASAGEVSGVTGPCAGQFPYLTVLHPAVGTLTGVRCDRPRRGSVLFGSGFGWLWANFKLLIPGDFLALAVALAIIDSKGLLGFGSAARGS
jgi:hypothetical protein